MSGLNSQFNFLLQLNKIFFKKIKIHPKLKKKFIQSQTVQKKVTSFKRHTSFYVITTNWRHFSFY